MTRIDLVFPSMGGEARVRLESVLHDEAELAALADGIHSQIEAVEAALSRFNPDSELSRLNRDPRPAVPASPLLRRAVAAALWAADYSDGLVDATLLGELELRVDAVGERRELGLVEPHRLEPHARLAAHRGEGQVDLGHD